MVQHNQLCIACSCLLCSFTVHFLTSFNTCNEYRAVLSISNICELLFENQIHSMLRPCNLRCGQNPVCVRLNSLHNMYCKFVYTYYIAYICIYRVCIYKVYHQKNIEISSDMNSHLHTHIYIYICTYITFVHVYQSHCSLC